MAEKDVMVNMVSKHSGEERQIGLLELSAAVVGFLDQLAVYPFIDRTFFEIIRDGSGSQRYERLLRACGHEGDDEGFFAELLGCLTEADGHRAIAIGGVELPHLLLMAVLEVALPGNRFLSIKSTEQLEQVANISIPEDDRADMQKVIDTYPVRLSMHTLRQMRVSGNVAYQYLPFVEELDPVGHTNTWIGQFHQGLLEQMYQNRVIFLLNMACPVYCRFCFRKHKDARNDANPTLEDVRAAVEHVAGSPSIKEVVVTGGDPFMNMENMACTIDGLLEVEHVQTLRLATRSIAYYPHMFLDKEAALLTYLKRKNLELQEKGKRLEVATHFIHPDEISPQALLIIGELTRGGICVYVQTPFLKGCNDQGPELVRLFSMLRGAGAELHYIYIPCSPIHGNSVYWSPISQGIAAGAYLRAHLSDRVIPRICTATPIGKMDWNTSGWAVEPVEDNDNFIWIRSPYTPDYFKEFAPIANELENIRVNEEGTIDIQYMAKIGDQALFLGARPLRLGGGMSQAESVEAVQELVIESEKMTPSLAGTRSFKISRVHETRVEVADDCPLEELYYIRGDERITDVVILSEVDAVDSLRKISAIVHQLYDIPHVNAVRLRSLKFNYAPQAYTPAVVDALAGLNRLTLADPQRLEIETQFLAAEEIDEVHGLLTRRLRNRGITVYCNTPLLGRINDRPDAIHQLAYKCRQAGIEFHHLYVAGLPLQNSWNSDNPVALYDVIDIATKVRREGSGREVPRYIIKTVVGEVDFGLSSGLEGHGENLSVVLSPYDLEYFKAISADFQWPEGVEVNTEGTPVARISGLLKTTDFALS